MVMGIDIEQEMVTAMVSILGLCGDHAQNMRLGSSVAWYQTLTN